MNIKSLRGKEEIPIKVRLGFQGTMFLIFSLLSLIGVTVTFSGVYLYMSNYMEKHSIENMEQLTVKMSEQIDSFYNEMDHISLQILYSPELIEIMRKAAHSNNSENYFTEHTEKERIVRKYLDSFIGPDLTVSRISMYNDRGDYVSMGIIPDKASVIRYQMQSDLYKASFSAGNDSTKFSRPHADMWSADRSQKLISFYREIRDVSDSYGIIEIQQNVSTFEKILRVPNSREMKVYVFDKDGLPAYISHDTELSDHITMQQLLGGQSTVNQADYIFASHQSPLSQWNIILAEPKSEFFSPIKVVGRLLFIVSLSIVALSLIMNFVITKQLTKPFRKMRDSIRNVSYNNLSIEIDDTSNEIILMNNAFESMFERLKDSMEQVVQARSREMKARMNALESQMNPHFLYNVLTVIGTTGEQAGVDKVMELCEKLSGILRYSSRNRDGEVTVRDELIYAQQYLDLMRERYEEHFQYRLEMDEETLTLEVPRLIFQPIIENCFRHAFQKVGPPWSIHLSIKQTVDLEWMFEVKDWGDGFDRAVLENLQQRMESYTYNADYINTTEESSGNDGGVGLFNTFIRLMVTYGEKAFYEILTNDPNGTIVRMGVRRK
ncbi:sensor histidine kinase [Cohnella sp.]|uniref:sensor histidine kinase n=1 Tax=Cohnella sp. TaxID=1883426 RepID=UPI00356463DE